MDIQNKHDLVFFLEDHIFKNEFSKKHLFRDEEEFHCLYRFVKEEYPEFVFSGQAYRVILLQNEKSLNDKEIGNSFAYSFKGLKKFIQNAKEDGKTFKKIALIEAFIVEGIDLYALVRELQQEQLIDHHRYIDEDEILAINYEASKIEFFTERQFYLLPDRH